MDFGKLPNVDKVDFSLPEDHPDNQLLFNRLIADSQKKSLFVGCPVWNDPGFVGKIYPEKTKQKDFLFHYARQFNSIEFNSTYYGVKPAYIDKWREAAPKGFLFSPKISRQISHYRQLNDCRYLTEAFCQRISAFDPFLGPLFLLLPPHFGPEKIKTLEKFLGEFPKGYQLGVEFRHSGWFDHPEAAKEAFDLLEKQNMVAIITDVAGRRDVLHQRCTSDTAIIRFVGNSLHPTDFSRIDDWADRLIEWYRKGVNQIFIWLHQPEEHLNVEVATHLVKQLNEKGGFGFSGPEILPKPDVQGSLF